MITLNKLIFDLWELVRPNLSDDDNFDKRQLAFWIQTQRALLVRNELNKNRTIDDNLIQDLGCLELELADKADCCDISDGCKILRTKDTIPNTIELHNKTAITRVAPIDKHTIPFSHVSYERAIWSGNGRFNSNQIFTFLLNDKIYVVAKNNSLLKYATHINVRGVFEDPQEVGKFNQCANNTVCYTDASKYPINAWMIDYMKAAILQLNFQTALQAPQDNTNNAKADNNEPT